MPKRTRVATGIYRDKYGLAATVKVGKTQREERFKPTTALETIEAWRARTRAELLEDREATAGEPAPAYGTYATDLPRFLKKIESRVAFKADRSHLRAWLPALGKTPRHKIRPPQIQHAVDGWVKAGVTPKTIRHRIRVLREMWHALDGAHARPPIKGLVLPAPTTITPTPVSWSLVQQVAKSLKAGLTVKKAHGPTRKVAEVHIQTPPESYARFLVRATTGQRPVQIMRAQPEDVDLERKIWFVRPAKDGNPIPLPLDRHMIHAWKTFIAAKAWGDFDLSSFTKLLHRHGWPTHVRPYNLRHTFAIDLLLDGADLGDVQGFLGHKRIETTRAHYAPILLARLQRVGRRLKRKTLA